MLAQNEYVMERINKDAYNRAYQEAETLRQLRVAGLLKTSAFPKLACKGLGCLGHALVAMGRRLEQMERSAAPA